MCSLSSRHHDDLPSFIEASHLIDQWASGQCPAVVTDRSADGTVTIASSGARSRIAELIVVLANKSTASLESRIGCVEHLLLQFEMGAIERSGGPQVAAAYASVAMALCDGHRSLSV